MGNTRERKVTVIALITAACILGDAMLFIVMPIYWRDFGLTALWQVGVLLSANRLIRLPINPLVGWFYQHMEKRTGVILAIILAAVSTLSYGWLKGFWLLLLMRCVWGVAWSLLRLGGFLTVIEVSNDQTRGRLMGKYNGLWGLGGLTGMLVGGLFVDVFSLELVATLFATISIISLLFAFRYIPRTKQGSQSQPKNNDNDLSFWRRKETWAVLGTGFMMAMVIFGIFLSTLSRLLDVQMNESFVWLGITIGAATVAGFIQAIKWGWDPFLAPLVGKVSDEKFGRIKILILAFLVSGLTFYLFTLEVAFWFLLILLLTFQLMSTILVTVSDSLASDVATQTSKVGLMTAYTVAVDLGAAFGPLFGYVIVDYLSLGTLYLLTAILLGFVGVFWLLLLRANSMSKLI
ncbi:MFS transporter [Tenuibacillus multivorans]|uniref:Predicted arabinose efflux permease, MFS family n=1 Tax=Tenuibacillus multivorans TaxID=237069 RepID=A0A1H0B5V0_9BACI|nr:MFS transporter [Tenuibacillus multivorans]GEL78633.1 MFS transporter [Tenuibacillus multivorans]SDN41004.1 Predicted arabinose efflux permease, MFS family [Tenuibacillus multivorans]